MRLPLRSFGRTGLRVSPLTLAGQRGGIGPADVEYAFHELGINTFFCSPLMRPLAAGIKRLVAAGHRDELVIVGIASLPFAPLVRLSWEAHARAFGTDRLDVFLLGWIQARWYPAGRTWPAMRDLQASGKARALGFSCHDRPLATELTRELGVDALMIRYNAAHRGAEKDVFEPLGGARPATIAYTATRWGGLLKEKAGLGPMSAGECYRFSLGHPSVDTVLCGARSREELKEDVEAVLQGPLPPARLDEVRRFGDAVRAGSLVFR